MATTSACATRSKTTLRRVIPASPDERRVFGAQQQRPLEPLSVPVQTGGNHRPCAGAGAPSSYARRSARYRAESDDAMTTEEGDVSRPCPGRTLVLIHGTPLGPESWSDIPSFAGRPTVAVDVTSVPRDLPQQTLAERIAREHEGDLDVVGHSFGGQIAIDLALLLPERVRTLTILCSRDTPFPAFAELAEQVRAGRPPPVAESLARWFTPAEVAADGPAVVRARQRLEAASGLDWAAALEGIAVFDRSARMHELRMPATVIGAGLDRVATPEAVMRMAQRLPEGELILRPQWAHMSPFAHPTELIALLSSASHAATVGSRRVR